MEQIFMVNDLRAKRSRQEARAFSHRLQKRLHFFFMLHDIGRYGTAIDGIDPMSGRRQQPAVFKLQLPYIADLTVIAGFLEMPGKLLELTQRAGVQEIDDRNVRILCLLLVGTIQLHKSVHPAVKQFKCPETITPPHFLMGRIVQDKLILQPVFVHPAGPVGVDLAEIELSRIFVIKNIKPGYGKHFFIAARQKDQFFQFFGKRKQRPVIRMA